MPKLTPNLWFDTQELDAAEFYVSVFPNSEITDIAYYSETGPGPAGSVLTVEFTLDGQPFTALNGGPLFTFDEAVSIVIDCADQAEVDYYWDRLRGAAAKKANADGSKTATASHGRSSPVGSWSCSPTRTARPPTVQWQRCSRCANCDVAALEAAFAG